VVRELVHDPLAIDFTLRRVVKDVEAYKADQKLLMLQRCHGRNEPHID
jgi:hypothetical protein